MPLEEEDKAHDEMKIRSSLSLIVARTGSLLNWHFASKGYGPTTVLPSHNSIVDACPSLLAGVLIEEFKMAVGMGESGTHLGLRHTWYRRVGKGHMCGQHAADNWDLPYSNCGGYSILSLSKLLTGKVGKDDQVGRSCWRFSRFNHWVDSSKGRYEVWID